jgi:serine protease Do
MYFPVLSFAMDFKTETIFSSIVVVNSGKSVGSGFAIDTHRIVTNAHVITSPNVTIKTYTNDSFPASIEYKDDNLDIAVLSVKAISFTPLSHANIENIQVGDEVYAVGTPNGMTYSLTKGIISAKDRNISGLNYFQTDAAVNMGNSGGPLLNQFGEVIGMNTLKLEGSEGISLALSIAVVNEYINQPEHSDQSENHEKSPESNAAIGSNVASNDAQPVLYSVLLITLVLSIIANVFLVIRNRILRNQLLLSGYNESSRTDFDIEIQG